MHYWWPHVMLSLRNIFYVCKSDLGNCIKDVKVAIDWDIHSIEYGIKHMLESTIIKVCYSIYRTQEKFGAVNIGKFGKL